MRNLYVKGHIQGVVNMVAEDGEAFCHLLVDDSPEGDAVVAALKAAGLIYDSGADGADFGTVPAKYKRQDGNPLHEFAGIDIKPPAVVAEGADPTP